ncbi:MAG TPA: hypothetical protein VF228_20165 [Iamia sp.]
MADGGWEWQAERQRWVAHAPVERGVVILGLVVVAGQVFMALTAPADSPMRQHPWLAVPWLLFFVPWGIGQVRLAIRSRVTCDGEIVEVVDGLVRTRFRIADIEALRLGPPVAPHLVAVRARRPERSIGGLRLPTLRGTATITPSVPAWWWHQIVGIPPERITGGRLRRAWAQVRRRPAIPGPVSRVSR